MPGLAGLLYKHGLALPMRWTWFWIPRFVAGGSKSDAAAAELSPCGSSSKCFAEAGCELSHCPATTCDRIHAVLLTSGFPGVPGAKFSPDYTAGTTNSLSLYWCYR